MLARLPVDEKVAESGDMGLPVVNDPSSKLSFMFTDLAQKVAQKLSILQAQTSI